MSPTKTVENAKLPVGPVDFISVIAIPITLFILLMGIIYSDFSWRFISIASATVTVAVSPLLFGLCKFQGYKQCEPAQVLKLARPMQWIFLVLLSLQFFSLLSITFP